MQLGIHIIRFHFPGRMAPAEQPMLEGYTTLAPAAPRLAELVFPGLEPRLSGDMPDADRRARAASE